MEIVASSYPINVSNKTFHNEAASLMCLETSKHFRCLFCLFPCSFGHRTHSPIISRTQILTTRLDFQKLFLVPVNARKYCYWTFTSARSLNSENAKIVLNQIGFSTTSQQKHRNSIRALFCRNTTSPFFLLQSLCCLGHPRWRMFKFQLNNSRFYMASRTSSTRIASHSIP